MDFAFTSCEDCYANEGCYWCPKDGVCTNPEDAQLGCWTCATEDYDETCSNEGNFFRYVGYCMPIYIYSIFRLYVSYVVY
jgi:hypothetical protein